MANDYIQVQKETFLCRMAASDWEKIRVIIKEASFQSHVGDCFDSSVVLMCFDPLLPSCAQSVAKRRSQQKPLFGGCLLY